MVRTCYLHLESGVDEYVAGIEAIGQVLTASLKDHEYGMREATVRDPDGNDMPPAAAVAVFRPDALC